MVAAEPVVPDGGGNVAPESAAVEVDVEGGFAKRGQGFTHCRAFLRRKVAFHGAALARHLSATLGDAALQGLVDARLELGGAVLVEEAQKGGDDGAEIAAALGGVGEQALTVGRGPDQPVLPAQAPGMTLVPGQAGNVLGDLDAGALVEAARVGGDDVSTVEDVPSERAALRRSREHIGRTPMPIHATINERTLRRTFREQVKGKRGLTVFDRAS